MPLPFLIGAAVIGAGSLIGAAAKSVNRDYEEELHSINQKINDLAEETEESFLKTKKDTEYKLDRLAFLKQDIYENSLKEFARAFKKIKNVKLSKSGNLKEKLHSLETITMDYSSNATVSYIQSEKEAAIKGAILGGLFGGTYLVTGLIKGVKLQYAIEEAQANYSKMKVEAEKVKAKEANLKKIARQANEMYSVLKALDRLFILAINEMKNNINTAGTDFSHFTEEQRQQLYVTVQLAESVKKLLDARVISSQGTPEIDSKKAVTEAKTLIHLKG